MAGVERQPSAAAMVGVVVGIVALLASVVGWGVVYGKTDERLTTVVATTAELKSVDAAMTARVGSVELGLRRLDNLEYRLGANEQQSANLARSIDDLKSSLASQGADIRVIREILTRKDRAAGAMVP